MCVCVCVRARARVNRHTQMTHTHSHTHTHTHSNHASRTESDNDNERWRINTHTSRKHAHTHTQIDARGTEDLVFEERSCAFFRAHQGEGNHVANTGRVSEEHHNTCNHNKKNKTANSDGCQVVGGGFLYVASSER